MTDKNIDYHSLTNQKILGDFVARAVILNATLLAEDLFNADLLSIDEIENYYSAVCPECGGELEKLRQEDKHIVENELEDDKWFCNNCDYVTAEEPEQEAQEIYEWWFVTEWLYEQLQAHGEPVINCGYGYLWGRGATGQAILLDSVMGEIAEDLEILAGQRNDWSTRG